MKSILLIDDDPSILGIFEATLRGEGYELKTARNGVDGLEMARAHRPDLIISDILMPGGDGRELLREIRRDPELGATQVVLMTGNVEDATTLTEIERGADDFLEKPLTIERILSCVRSRLRRAEVHAQVENRMLESLRTTIHATLPHEFFTPLAGMLGVIQLLRSDLPELDRGEVESLLGEIESAGWRLHRTLRNYLAIIELQANPDAGGDAPCDLAAGVCRTILEQRVEVVKERHDRAKDCICQIDPPDLLVAPEAFGKIAEEVIDNAFHFSPRGHPVTVEMTPQGILRVRDEGRGMTSEQLRHLNAFRQFDRAHYEQQGLGLGLAIAHHLLRRVGASIFFSSRPGAGTSVEVRFPLRKTSAAASVEG
jgi:signal transduction histidine kinase